MKSLALSDKYGWSRYVAYQAYYSLAGREFEWELMPLCLQEGLGCVVWSPLAGGALTGKIRRNQPAPKSSRIGTIDFIPYREESLHKIVDVLDEISKETEKTIAQISLNWLLQRPGVSNIVIGARNEEQLKQNLGAIGWTLSREQGEKLDKASECEPIYPYWHQRGFPDLIPTPVKHYKIE
jgi:aryl-alcohol dehydrogenase-like predicted oxidoreductase